MARAAGLDTRKTINFAAKQMPHRMAGEKIQRQQDYVHQENQSPHTDAKSVREGESDDCIVPEKHEKNDRDIHKISMDILQYERESGLAGVVALALRHRACRRIEKKSAVIGFSIVIASGAETERPAENQ